MFFPRESENVSPKWLFPGYAKNFLPIVWAASIVKRAKKEGRIEDDHAVKTIIKELDKFRGLCGSLQ